MYKRNCLRIELFDFIILDGLFVKLECLFFKDVFEWVLFVLVRKIVLWYEVD